MTERDERRNFHSPVSRLGPLFTLPGLLVILLAMSTWPANAQKDGPIVTVTTLLSVVKAVPGGMFQVAVVAKLAKGFHVNAHRPTEKWLIPTELTTAALVGASVESVLYPKPVEKALAFSGDDQLALYEDTFTVGFNVRVTKTLRPGKYTLKAVLGYQACNDQMCMAPDEVPVSVVFEVGKSGAGAKSVNREVFSRDPFVSSAASGKR